MKARWYINRPPKKKKIYHSTNGLDWYDASNKSVSAPPMDKWYEMSIVGNTMIIKM